MDKTTGKKDGYCDGQNVCPDRVDMLGFALPEPARAAQVPALLTSSRSFFGLGSRWREELASAQAKGGGGGGVSCVPRRRSAFLCRHRLAGRTHSSTGLRLI